MIKITGSKLVRMTEEQVERYNAINQCHLFDDNGSEADGDLYLIPVEEVEPFVGMEIVDGFIVDAYSENANYSDFTGFSSRNEAYTISRETAEAIALDEYPRVSDDMRLHLLETPHGTRYWRWNHHDSDDSRGEHHVASFYCSEEDAEGVGQTWIEGASVAEIAEILDQPAPYDPRE